MIKVSADLVSSEVAFFGLQMADFSLCPHIALLLCTFLPRVSGVSRPPFLLRTPVRLE